MVSQTDMHTYTKLEVGRPARCRFSLSLFLSSPPPLSELWLLSVFLSSSPPWILVLVSFFSFFFFVVVAAVLWKPWMSFFFFFVLFLLLGLPWLPTSTATTTYAPHRSSWNRPWSREPLWNRREPPIHPSRSSSLAWTTMIMESVTHACLEH